MFYKFFVHGTKKFIHKSRAFNSNSVNDHFQLPNGEDVLQSIKDDREQEQE